MTAPSNTSPTWHQLSVEETDRAPIPWWHGRERITMLIVPCLFSAIEEWKWKRGQRAASGVVV